MTPDANSFGLESPRFAERARAVREALDNGEALSLGEIADRLEMPFEILVDFLASAMLAIDPDIADVVIADVTGGTIH